MYGARIRTFVAAGALFVASAHGATLAYGAATARPLQVPKKERVEEVEIAAEPDPETGQPTWRRVVRGRDGRRPCLRFTDGGGASRAPGFDDSGSAAVEAGVTELFLQPPRVRRVQAEWLSAPEPTPSSGAGSTATPAHLERVELWADAWGGVREIARARVTLEELARGSGNVRVCGQPTEDGWDVYVPSGESSARVSDDRIDDGVFTCGHAHVHLDRAPMGEGPLRALPSRRSSRCPVPMLEERD